MEIGFRVDDVRLFVHKPSCDEDFREVDQYLEQQMDKNLVTLRFRIEM